MPKKKQKKSESLPMMKPNLAQKPPGLSDETRVVSSEEPNPHDG